MELFELNVVRLDGEAVVHLAGELDLTSSPRCRSTLVELLESGDRVVVDLSGLTLIDSTGISALLAARRVAAERSASFVLRDPQPQVAKVLRIMQLESTLDIRHTR